MRLRRRDSRAETLRWCRDIVAQVHDLGPRIRRMNDGELRALTVSYRDRVARGESLDDLLPEAFATVREAAERALGQRPWDTQVMGGAVLHRGQIAETLTGEGKTLTATLPAYLHALAGQGVHVMTANDHLADRDAHWMRPVYEFLGLTAGLIQDLPKREIQSQRAAYTADVTYGTAEDFVFDYLRDNSAWGPDEIVQRGQHSAIIDEADLILIDQATSRPGLADPAVPASKWPAKFAELAAQLRAGEHYRSDRRTRTVLLTEDGARAAEDYLGIDDLYRDPGAGLVPYLLSAIQAKEHYQRHRDYLVHGGKVVTIDQKHGRTAPNRPFEQGVHAAIAAKEGLKVPGDRPVTAEVPMWDYLRRYERLSGMTGTARDDAEAYQRLYRRDVVEIPPHRPVIRVDHADVLYSDRETKLAALADETASRHAAGQPVLVGCLSIEEARSMADLLEDRGVHHRVLTALNQRWSSNQIIANAGALGAVTVVATMAGRGVDILLGGAGGSDRDRVAALGGLCVLGTGRPTSRRLEMHLRGRAGRQGDPGESKFFVSMDDETVIRHLGPRSRAIYRRMKLPEGKEMPPLSKGITDLQVATAAGEAAALVHRRQWDEVFAAQYRTLCAERAPAARGGDMSEYVRSLIDQVSDPAHGFTQAAYRHREAEVGIEALRKLERHVILRCLDHYWTLHLRALPTLKNASTIHGTGQEALTWYRVEAGKAFDDMLKDARHDIVSNLFTLDPLAEVSVVMVVDQGSGGLPDSGVVDGQQGDDQARGE